ncbi:uncharacterized protein LOC116182501 [Photinus pyralis]|uniref:uncharacterized protein LOC116169814 n=1 Tax=Photinus pyralis TaxID=7054 RepID=UPI001266F434|nr:uncharacterized protein LOC116169814 [Photinus pyralis]XP_031352215.1 uncharacterized protein LOC116177385 [Photinus pyralis]XP_031358892.1 uncharacterized protein LOC116182501 [Photinus pyralis]
MNTYTILLRVGISQCVLFSVLCYVFVTLGCTLTTESLSYYHIERNVFYVTAGYFLVPLIFSVILLLGVLKEILLLVRVWILSSILNAVLLFCLLLTASIRISRFVAAPWAILLNVLPVLLIWWMSDNTVVVVECYKHQEHTRKQTKIKKDFISRVLIV